MITTIALKELLIPGNRETRDFLEKFDSLRETVLLKDNGLYVTDMKTHCTLAYMSVSLFQSISEMEVTPHCKTDDYLFVLDEKHSSTSWAAECVYWCHQHLKYALHTITSDIRILITDQGIPSDLCSTTLTSLKKALMLLHTLLRKMESIPGLVSTLDECPKLNFKHLRMLLDYGRYMAWLYLCIRGTTIGKKIRITSLWNILIYLYGQHDTLPKPLQELVEHVREYTYHEMILWYDSPEGMCRSEVAEWLSKRCDWKQKRRELAQKNECLSTLQSHDVDGIIAAIHLDFPHFENGDRHHMQLCKDECPVLRLRVLRREYFFPLSLK